MANARLGMQVPNEHKVGEPWKSVRLGDVANVVTKHIQPSGFSGQRYIALEDLDTGQPVLQRWTDTTRVRSAKSAFQTGDVLFAKLRPYLEKGVRAPFDGVCSTDLMVIRAGSDLMPEFLGFLAHTRRFIEHAVKHTAGVNHPRTSWAALAGFFLDLPQLEEQWAIVLALNAIQAARLARVKEIELERERKAALMAHLFAYGTKNEARRDTPLGPLPESWECLEIREVAHCQSGGTPSRGNPTYFGGEIPWVKTLDMNDGQVSSTEERITQSGLASIRGKVRPRGTVMVAMYGGSGTVGKCGILGTPAATNQAVCCVETKRERCLPEFLFQYFVFIRAVWMQYAGGTRKDPNIGKGIVEKKLIPLPTPEEQEIIANCLRASQRRVGALESETQLFEELFRAMLEELMSGRLSVAPLLAGAVA